MYKELSKLLEEVEGQHIAPELEKELWDRIREYYKALDDEEFNEYVKEYTFIETMPEVDGDRLVVELRAELGYEEMSKLEDALDAVIQKHDPDAYFDMVYSGVAEAFLNIPYKNEAVEETKNYKRERQASPKSCKEGSFRTKEVNEKGDKVILCKDKKTDKMKAQSVLKKKNEELKNQITIQEWQALDKEDQKQYIRNQWNPKKYDLKKKNEAVHVDEMNANKFLKDAAEQAGYKTIKELASSYPSVDDIVNETGVTANKEVLDYAQLIINRFNESLNEFKKGDRVLLDNKEEVTIFDKSINGYFVERNSGSRPFEVSVDRLFKIDESLNEDLQQESEFNCVTRYDSKREMQSAIDEIKLDNRLEKYIENNQLLYLVYDKDKPGKFAQLVGESTNKVKEFNKQMSKQKLLKEEFTAIEFEEDEEDGSINASNIVGVYDTLEDAIEDNKDNEFVQIFDANDELVWEYGDELDESLNEEFVAIEFEEDEDGSINASNIVGRYNSLEDAIADNKDNEFVQIFDANDELVWEYGDMNEDCDICKIKMLNRLDHIVKTCQDTEMKQRAVSLLDNLGMGVDVKEEVEKLFKEIDDKKPKKEKKDDMEDNRAIKGLMEELEELLNEVDDLDLPAVVEEPKDIEDDEQDIENDEQDIEIEEIADEIMDKIEDAVEDRIEDRIAAEEELEDAVEELEDEDEIVEDYKKYLRTSQLEDLQDTKREIDKAAQQGKSPEEVKAVIDIKSDDDKEKEEAEKYAVDKLTESLLATSKTSLLKDLKK